MARSRLGEMAGVGGSIGAIRSRSTSHTEQHARGPCLRNAKHSGKHSTSRRAASQRVDPSRTYVPIACSKRSACRQADNEAHLTYPLGKMPWWSKFLGDREKGDAAGRSGERAVWIPADKNRLGVPILDLIRVTGPMISTSRSAQAAVISASWSAKMVSEVPVEFAPSKSFPCDLRYASDPDLQNGWSSEP
jgi:hypothetical protein